MALRAPRREWLEQVREPIIDPERPIVDPHHHLWIRDDWRYELDELWADTGSGHKITKKIKHIREMFTVADPITIKKGLNI